MLNRIKELRKRKGLTQEQLAPLIGVAQSTLSGWETCKIDVATDSLKRLADIFDCSVDYILCRTNSPYSVIKGSQEGLSFEEIEEITKYSEIKPYIHFLKYGNHDKFVLFGMAQSDFMRHTAKKDHIYYNCWGPVSLNDLADGFCAICNKKVPSEDYYISGSLEMGFTQLPPTIISVRKVEGDRSLVIINASAFPRPQNTEDALKVALGFIKPIITIDPPIEKQAFLSYSHPSTSPLKMKSAKPAQVAAKGGGMQDAPDVDYDELKAAQRQAKAQKHDTKSE